MGFMDRVLSKGRILDSGTKYLVVGSISVFFPVLAGCDNIVNVDLLEFLRGFALFESGCLMVALGALAPVEVVHEEVIVMLLAIGAISIPLTIDELYLGTQMQHINSSKSAPVT
jgi:hypothetical protein